MHKIYKIVLIVLIITFSFYYFFSLIGDRKHDDSWYVLFNVIPDSIKLKDIEFSHISYILQQTHKPLFRKKNLSEYESDILVSWTRSSDNKSYELCPNQELLFYKHIKFSSEYLYSFLKEKTLLEERDDLNFNANCVVIKFKNENKQFLKKFSKLALSPSIELNEKVDVGLGAFEVENINEEIVQLKRKTYKRASINKIIVKKYKNFQSFFVNENRFVDDVNRLPFNEIPTFLIENMNKFLVNQLQVAILILNIKDNSLRSKIYDCIDIKNLTTSFMGDHASLQNVSTVVPVGLKGGKADILSRKCRDIKLTKAVDFLNWKENSKRTLEQYFEKFYLTSGVKINIMNIGNQELEAVANNKIEKDYITIIGVDSLDGELVDFYNGLINKENHILALQNKKLFELYEELKQSEELEVVNQIEEIISKSKVILPLFQVNKIFYYPKNIQMNGDTSDISLRSPNIAEISL